MQNKDLNAFRKDYVKGTLNKEALNANPLQQFQIWFDEVIKSEQAEPNAVFLSTINDNAQPSCRTVLIKSFNAAGFTFYTNYNSRKAKDIEAHPLVSLLFFWDSLQRQVRIEGKAFKCSAAQSDQYFQTRSKSSQIGANISPQSQEIESRAWLEDAFANFEASADQITRPTDWGGITIVPHYYEFWQGRASRLHDRFIYSLNKTADWEIKRLAP